MSEKETFYPKLDAKNDVVAREKMTIEYWQQNRTFEKSVERRRGAEEFVFYDGPPFANGQPHYGHIFVAYVKDTIARFQTMLGKKVERPFGWDCHGLPAEMAAVRPVPRAMSPKRTEAMMTRILRYRPREAAEWLEIRVPRTIFRSEFVSKTDGGRISDLL